MAYIEISNLPETRNLDDNSVFPAVYQGETKKVSFSTLKSLMKFFKSASYNKTTGVFTFGLSDTTQATLSTDLNLSIKDIGLEDYTLTLTKQDGTTETIILPQQDLTDYVKNTDYASNSKGGVIKVANGYAIEISNIGQIRARVNTYENYQSADVASFISKGTLENVLNARIGDISTILQELDTGSGV